MCASANMSFVTETSSYQIEYGDSDQFLLWINDLWIEKKWKKKMNQIDRIVVRKIYTYAYANYLISQTVYDLILILLIGQNGIWTIWWRATDSISLQIVYTLFQWNRLPKVDEHVAVVHLQYIKCSDKTLKLMNISLVFVVCPISMIV